MQTQIPQHIGFIVDGNRRWAKAHGLSINEGHKTGCKNIETIARTCFSLGITSVTFYVFSTENWDRSEKEVNFLMSLFEKKINTYIQEFSKEDIKVNIIGEKDKLAQPLKTIILQNQKKTIGAVKGNLNLALNYGGQSEIISICRKLSHEGEIINKENIEKNLYLAGQPPVDLIIRTSGEMRLSGFLLWQSAYAEFYFSKKYWPEFTPNDLKLAIEDYSKRKRRFGK
ncbi:MAG TPA: polyprenyl diphosphate synthase [Candidatus Paceibacterota bacterium]|nr:polyprenyl diphosphate synthase [Candidatus Paceibacterota bacterium]